jgi:hypothetical protein
MSAQDHITSEENSAAVDSNWNEHCNEYDMSITESPFTAAIKLRHVLLLRDHIWGAVL